MNRMHEALIAGAALAALTLTPAFAADAFESVVGPYDTIHQALAADSTDGVAGPAKELAKELDALAQALTADEAGVSGDELAAVKKHVAEASAAATELAGAGTLEAARTAFGDLSEALVAWRNLSESGPAVAYCPMVKKHWLEADTETLENPYYGSSMLRCGSIQSK